MLWARNAARFFETAAARAKRLVAEDVVRELEGDTE
jgi:hypothetical protein